jgi:hypothetical protein
MNKIKRLNIALAEARNDLQSLIIENVEQAFTQKEAEALAIHNLCKAFEIKPPFFTTEVYKKVIKRIEELNDRNAVE